VVGRDEGGRGDGGVFVDNARLDEALNRLHSRGVNDAAEGADRIGAVYDVAADGRVLHDGRGDHDDIVGRARELLDDQVDHLAQRGILVLEELGDAEEEGRGFLAAPVLAGEEEEGQLGQDLDALAGACRCLLHRTYHAAFPRRDGALVEDSRCVRCQLPYRQQMHPTAARDGVAAAVPSWNTDVLSICATPPTSSCFLSMVPAI
jgi:hypothetical protein